MSLANLHRAMGAKLAPDNIPLHYGDQSAEYQAGLEDVILLDRSHEGRIILEGANLLAFLGRMSTNKLLDMAPGDGRPTLFTNPNGRIIDRVVVYAPDTDQLILITEPGRNEAVLNYLRSNIFFQDQVKPINWQPETHQLALHGPSTRSILEKLLPDAITSPKLSCHTVEIEGVKVFIARRKPLSGDHWVFIMPNHAAEAAYKSLLTTSQATPAGSLTYNILRIRSGRPSRPELIPDYIPLELGLWDEVSFNKGCYTGQEIIARMESRGKIARTMVSLEMAQAVEAPADLFQDGSHCGKLTSSVTAPNGDIFALGVIKTAAAVIGTPLTVGQQHIPATVKQLVGVQPPWLNPA